MANILMFVLPAHLGRCQQCDGIVLILPEYDMGYCDEIELSMTCEHHITDELQEIADKYWKSLLEIRRKTHVL